MDHAKVGEDDFSRLHNIQLSDTLGLLVTVSSLERPPRRDLSGAERVAQ